MNNDFKEKVLDIFNNNNFCVVGTIGLDKEPQGAVMAFSHDNKLRIYFQTPNTSRKYRNLHEEPRVSITLGWNPETMVTVQYNGIAREVTSQEERESIIQIHTTKNEASKAYAHLPNNIFFVVEPKFIRYSDLINNIILDEVIN